ncbi:PR domain zinc finger protein 5-like isoform X7 [Vanessa cardui]|uniref:PR domain zinc finger protein 5-like isoform X7 n=1 Tax=Vanessa cardui TaxID=171605 RepID=UPI001F1308A1|nr:PR domain zinc finger protein 5-like isoform X7 [Vanessa cardui]
MEFDEIVVKESPGLCRCCLSEGCYKDLGTEYTWMDETEVYADMLFECFDISISQHMEGPNGPNRLICEVCITRLRDACNFKKQVLHSEKKFVDMVGRGDFKSKVIVYQEQMKSEMVMEPQPAHDADVEYLDEDIDYDDGNKDDSNEPTVSEDITVDALPIKGKRGRPKKTTVKPEKKKSKLEEKTKPKIVKGKSRKVKRIRYNTKDISTSDSDDDLPIKDLKPKLSFNDKLSIMRNNVIQVVIKSTVMPFRWLRSSYRCFYCYDVFREPKDLKFHQNVHSVEDEIPKAMENYWEPEVYVDISNLSCKLCPDTITELYQLVDHLILKHKVAFNKDIGMGMNAFKLDEFSVNCLICDHRFSTFGHLLVHTNKDHKGWSEVLCDVCGQHFRNAKYLRQHIRNEHTKKSVVCTLCGLTVISKNKLRTHMQNSHNHRYKCYACSDQFATHYKRSQHMMLAHKSREVIKCSYCPRSFVYRSSMMRHVRETHLQERTAICNVCGWRSFAQYDLQKHMMKHSNERNFKCPACDKAFKTKKTMRQHYNNIHQKSKSQDGIGVTHELMFSK